MNRLIVLVCLGFLLSGCTYSLHQAGVQDIQPSVRSSKAVSVSALGEQFSVLGFNSETEYVNQAYAALQAKCPRGEITGINTRYSTALGFFSWTNKIYLSGWCVQ